MLKHVPCYFLLVACMAIITLIVITFLFHNDVVTLTFDFAQLLITIIYEEEIDPKSLDE